MKFTDTFIRKPVLALVVSLLVLVLGLRSLFGLPVRQFPKTENGQVTITTTYYGASADVVAGFITTPIEAAVAEAQGIDYISSTSANSVSTITVTLKLNYDANRAVSEINTKVNSVLNQLPPEAQQPVISAQVGETLDAMYLGFNSAELPANQLTDYLVRVIQPKLQSVPGVQKAEVLGGREYALRAWLDPVKLAAVNLTATDVYTALAANNYLSAIGNTKGQMVGVDLTAATDLHSAEEFQNLIIKQKGTSMVRLKDVATVVLGATTYDVNVAFKGIRSVFVGVKVAPNANVLTVVAAVRKVLPELFEQLPVGMKGAIAFDSTSYIESSIHDVVKTLIETLIIVTVVIFLFLGSIRSVIVPVLAMPLSLIGAFFIMLVLGYSVNLLTLLALVLAIGLVVDDAIIVVENVDRHMKLGATPFKAALVAARELAGPIIAISVVLIAVYVPIGFRSGLTGALFSEFAFTLAGAVGISALIALTLSPMMCAKMLKSEHANSPFVQRIDRIFERFSESYQNLLSSMLDAWGTVVIFGFIIVGLVGLMMVLPQMGVMAQQELAPAEDQGYLFHLLTAAPNATSQQMGTYSKQTFEIMKALPEFENSFQIDGAGATNSGFGGVLLKDYSQRSRPITEINAELQKDSGKIAGANVFWINPPALPGSGGGFPVQFVLGTTAPFSELYEVAQSMLQKAQATGKFWVIDTDLKVDKPETRVEVDHDKLALLGLTSKDVGAALGGMLGGGYVNYFSIQGRSYRVIPQVLQRERLNPEQIPNYYIRAANGTTVPASTVVKLNTTTVPESITHFQQLNSATIQGVFGGTQGEALAMLKQIAAETLPSGYSIDYGGESRQYVQESGGFLNTLMFALIIIFLTLSAQFESFKDPLVVMMSVPMAIFGAVVFMFEGAATLNVYTQVGLVTLVGLIAKHGILIVQFANELQLAGRSKRQAIEQAAAIRLRPILMTTAAMVLGVVPLIIATGAGAVSRNHMGIVIASGISIGTLFTLFVVPAMYMRLGTEHSRMVMHKEEEDELAGGPESA